MKVIAWDELEKLKSDETDKRYNFEFWCVICKEFRTGNACADIKIGGWYCACHKSGEL